MGYPFEFYGKTKSFTGTTIDIRLFSKDEGLSFRSEIAQTRWIFISFFFPSFVLENNGNMGSQVISRTLVIYIYNFVCRVPVYGHITSDTPVFSSNYRSWATSGPVVLGWESAGLGIPGAVYIFYKNIHIDLTYFFSWLWCQSDKYRLTFLVWIFISFNVGLGARPRLYRVFSIGSFFLSSDTEALREESSIHYSARRPI